MKRIVLPHEDIRISGLPWYEHNKQRMWRLPYELEDVVGKDIWDGSKETSGVRLSFSSDTTSLSIKVKNTGKPYPGKNMSTIGKMGIDMHVDGQFWSCVCLDEESEMEGSFFENISREFREFTLHLPLYYNAEIIQVIVDDEATIKQPKPFSHPKPVIFYGTSITQGGAVSRAGLSYQAILSRALNIDFVNLGYSGIGRGEEPIAEVMSEIDAACYVLEYGLNNKTVENLKTVYLPFINKIRTIQKETPIILVTPIFNSAELWKTDFIEKIEGMRDVVREAYKTCFESGDKNIYIIEGSKLLSSEDYDGLMDGVHPNDIGFFKMANGLKNLVEEVLQLNP